MLQLVIQCVSSQSGELQTNHEKLTIIFTLKTSLGANVFTEDNKSSMHKGKNIQLMAQLEGFGRILCEFSRSDY